MLKKEVNFNATNSLAHTKWNCKYHIVFAPKYRRKVFYKTKRDRPYLSDVKNTAMRERCDSHPAA